MKKKIPQDIGILHMCTSMYDGQTSRKSDI